MERDASNDLLCILQSGERRVLFPPRILLSKQVWQKLSAYARFVSTEIAGLGTADVTDGCVTVTDVFTLPQYASKERVLIRGETIAEFLEAFVERGGDATALCVQWHSHGPWEVGWSALDELNIGEYFSLAPLAVSLEVNHAGECLGRIDLRSPLRLSVEAEVVLLLDELPSEVSRACQVEVRRNVTVLSTRSPSPETVKGDQNEQPAAETESVA